MESIFRTDFSSVRIHVGPAAASIGAFAFTCGSDIYFAPGQYDPHSTRGQRILRHELTHVVQQRSGRVSNPFGSGLAVVHDPRLEAEAERMAISGAPVLPLRSSAAQPSMAPPTPARPAAPWAPGVLQKSKEPSLGQGKRKKKVSAKFQEANLELPGEKKLQNLTKRQIVLKDSKRHLDEDSSDSEILEKKIKTEVTKAKKPPSGIFLSYGERNELHWAPTDKTGGKNADDYMYDNANDTQTDKNSIKKYKCKKCGNYFPRKRDRVDKEAYITVDHSPPMSKRLEDMARWICDGEDVWEGVVYKEAMESYNDISKLQLMCSSHNSSKGGKQGYLRWEPTIITKHVGKNCQGEHF